MPGGTLVHVFPMDRSGIPSGTDYPFRLLRRSLRFEKYASQSLQRLQPEKFPLTDGLVCDVVTVIWPLSGVLRRCPVIPG